MKKLTFENQWLSVFTDRLPINPVEHPVTGVVYQKWLRYHLSPSIWLPLDSSNIPIKEYFHCSNCNKWLFFGGTKSNLNRHIKVDLNVQTFDENVTPELNNQIIKKKLEQFILINGLPFKKIEDKYLQDICSILPSRKVLSKSASDLASKIEKVIIKELHLHSECCISIDEWQDQLLRRYLGITVQALSHGKVNNYVLSLEFIPYETASGENLKNIIQLVLEKYKILEKIKVCVTDSGSNMIAACNYFNFTRLPCICHVLNILIKTMIKPSFHIFEDIFKIQREMSNPRFITYLHNRKSKILAIPSYSTVRWFSLTRLLSSLNYLKDSIISFRTLDKMSPITPQIWNNIKILLEFFEIYEEIVKVMEKDEFGTISYILRCINTISKKVNELPETFNDSKAEFLQKLDDYWGRYKHFWDPLLYAATRLNPSLSVSAEMSAPEITRGDNLILDILKKIPKNQSPIVQNPISKNPFIHFQTDTSYNNDDILIFEEYKSVQIEGMPNLLDYWESQKKGKFRNLSIVAMDILSFMCTSSSAERFFSVSKRVSFNRMGLSPKKMQDVSLIVGNKEIAETLMNQNF